MSLLKITDAGVAGLPIHEGRAELLEEIMASTPAESTDRPSHTPPPHRGRWLPVLGAAAAVAVIAAAIAVPGWLDDEKQQVSETPVGAPGAGDIAVLPEDGWTLEHASVDEEYGGELSYVLGCSPLDKACPDGQELDIHWRPADQYQSYFDDRQDIGRGTSVDVLGEPATLWSYSADDHTVIREIVGDFSLEVRGTGMAEASFRDLLAQLQAIAPADLDAHLPEEFVADAERADAIAEMLGPIPLPDGFDTAIESTEISRYQLGADVTSAVACAWIGQFAESKRAGDQASMQAAADAMATSRDWPILKEMLRQGEWSDVIWDYADQMAAGEVPRGYREGIGCMQGAPEE